MNKKLRRKLSTRGKIKDSNRPRLVVSRSNKHIFAQIIDVDGRSLLGISDKSLKSAKGNKTELAALVGAELGKKAVAKKITEVVFDRGEYKYHGRVKALADKAREAGLKF